MTYQIGIGALIEDESFNEIRALELEIYENTNDFKGLIQPPHITIKRPFVVNNLEELKEVIRIIQQISKTTYQFNIELGSVENFSQTVLYLSLVNIKEIFNLHLKLVELLREKFPSSINEFDGDGVIFHTTVAMDIKAEIFDIEKKLILPKAKTILNKPVKINKLGLFLALDNETQWVVVFETPLTALKV